MAWGLTASRVLGSLVYMNDEPRSNIENVVNNWTLYATQT